MYVAFKSFAPEMDVGFDLSKEYAAGKTLTRIGAGSDRGNSLI